jgi:hypothetical protein
MELYDFYNVLRTRVTIQVTHARNSSEPLVQMFLPTSAIHLKLSIAGVTVKYQLGRIWHEATHAIFKYRAR